MEQQNLFLDGISFLKKICRLWFYNDIIIVILRQFFLVIIMTIEDIKQLISNDETRTLELKKTTGELKDGMRTACAFLNTDGGWLLFGIAPTSLKILGQEVTDNTKKEIAREIAKLKPMIDVPVEYINVPEHNGYQVIAIHLKAHTYWDAPYTYDDRPYMRIESTTIVMPRDIFEDRLIRNRHNHYSWESQICENLGLMDKIGYKNP